MKPSPTNTHLYLVSGQATPNITPALDAATRPQRVILLVSPDMQQRAQWLEQVLKTSAGVEVIHWLINHPWDIEHIQDRVIELLAEYENESIALNATGGTKPMSIAAYEAFRALDKPIFYVHPERDELIWMHPRDLPRHLLADRIRIGQFVQAHGGRVTEKADEQIPPALRDFTGQLIQDIERYSDALGVLNYYAHGAKNSLLSKPLDSRHLRFDALSELIDQLVDIGLVQLQGKQIKFMDEDARFFVNGGWLEQHVFATLNSLKKEIPAIQDTAMSLRVERQGSVSNEIDTAFLADNKLHLIECKAKKFQQSNSSSGTETLYKLDSVADMIGGLQARAMLVSYRPLAKHDLRRAGELKIKVIQQSQLQQLRQHLATWIRKNIKQS